MGLIGLLRLLAWPCLALLGLAWLAFSIDWARVLGLLAWLGWAWLGLLV